VIFLLASETEKEKEWEKEAMEGVGSQQAIQKRNVEQQLPSVSPPLQPPLWIPGGQERQGRAGREGQCVDRAIAQIFLALPVDVAKESPN
jgi:hypothetical protein